MPRNIGCELERKDGGEQKILYLQTHIFLYVFSYSLLLNKVVLVDFVSHRFVFFCGESFAIFAFFKE